MLRVLFAGSPAIAVPALEALVADGVLVGLLTNPDSPRGRSGKPEPTECSVALERGQTLPIPVLKLEKLDSAAREQVEALKPDILVSFAYGKIFGPKFLGLFPMGGINIHPSLLPKYRGPTPIPAAILNRETETGITIQRLAAEMDSGDILAQETVPLDGRETTESLSLTMAKKAAELLPPLLSRLALGNQQERPQDHGAASYCSLIAKADGLIDWNMSAKEIDARIRAFTPWPLSWTMHGDLQLLILKAQALGSDGNEARPGEVLGKDKNKGILIQTGEGILAVSELQYRTKKALEWKAFLNGARNFIGERLGVGI
ncbi:MAG: methionyl-tRNA formyltransferase [Treponema sp.]|nr:methionyl-tRNA formyltransferase [Treponema sp.]